MVRDVFCLFTTYLLLPVGNRVNPCAKHRRLKLSLELLQQQPLQPLETCLILYIYMCVYVCVATHQLSRQTGRDGSRGIRDKSMAKTRLYIIRNGFCRRGSRTDWADDGVGLAVGRSIYQQRSRDA